MAAPRSPRIPTQIELPAMPVPHDRASKPSSSLKATLAEIAPYAQGEFDGFCGLYTIINALRLALYPVRPLAYAGAKSLFRTGIRYLERHDMLAIAGFGMPLPSWQRLADDVVAAVSEMVAVPLTIERPFPHFDVGWVELLGRIRRLIDEDRAVMLVLRGAYRHHSIVTGYSATRLRLFDSAGFHWVTIASCRLSADDDRARHHVPPQSLAALKIGVEKMR